MFRTLRYFISCLLFFIGCVVVDKQDFAKAITKFVKVKVDGCETKLYTKDDIKNILQNILNIHIHCINNCNPLNNCSMGCEYYNNCNGESSYLYEYLIKQMEELNG